MDERAMQHGQDWTGEDLTGWVLTEKFDGCRAFWDGQRLWSRGGLSPQVPAAWLQALPTMALDCELYDGPGGVYRCGTALRLGRFTPGMHLLVFDAPALPGTYAQRMAAVAQALEGLDCASVAPFTLCQGTDHAVAFMREIQARKGEGAMARHPGLQYHPGRTAHLLKVKHDPRLQSHPAH